MLFRHSSPSRDRVADTGLVRDGTMVTLPTKRDGIGQAPKGRRMENPPWPNMGQPDWSDLLVVSHTRVHLGWHKLSKVIVSLGSNTAVTSVPVFLHTQTCCLEIQHTEYEQVFFVSPMFQISLL